MTRMRGVLAHSPAIAISMLALVFAVGSGAGYAASTVTSNQSTNAHSLVFHPLKIERGWSGSLFYAESNGVIYLAGTAGSSDKNPPPIMAKLPKSIAHFGFLNIPVTFGVEGDGFIQLLSGGRIHPIPPTGGDFKNLFLDGVSFPADAP